MVLEFKIRTAPLRKYAADHQIEMLSLAVRLPDADITETEPPVRTPTLPFKKMTVSLERLSELHRRYSWRIDSAIPDFVTVRFGLSSKSVARAKYTQIRAVTGANPRFNSGKVFSELFVTA